jgi:hypothetical protein
MWAFEERYRADYKRKLESYEREVMQYDRDVNDYKHKRRDFPPTKPDKPICRRAIVGNITVEKLVTLLADNPRGVLSLHDELTSLISSLNQYKGGRGNDQQFYLSAWNCAPYPYDRVSRGDALLSRPFLSIFGNILPTLLPRLKSVEIEEDGFFRGFCLGIRTRLKHCGRKRRCPTSFAMATRRYCNGSRISRFHLTDPLPYRCSRTRKNCLKVGMTSCRKRNAGCWMRTCARFGINSEAMGHAWR